MRTWRSPQLGQNIDKCVLANSYTPMCIDPSHWIDTEKCCMDAEAIPVVICNLNFKTFSRELGCFVEVKVHFYSGPLFSIGRERSVGQAGVPEGHMAPPAGRTSRRWSSASSSRPCFGRSTQRSLRAMKPGMASMRPIPFSIPGTRAAPTPRVRHSWQTWWLHRHVSLLFFSPLVLKLSKDGFFSLFDFHSLCLPFFLSLYLTSFLPCLPPSLSLSLTFFLVSLLTISLSPSLSLSLSFFLSRSFPHSLSPPPPPPSSLFLTPPPLSLSLSFSLSLFS